MILAIFEVTKTPYSAVQRPSTEIKSNDITTENQSAGLTSPTMEKVVSDLYAILQAQNENIRANLVENATDATTDAEEVATELSTTTTTSTTEPTTTSTTTTTTTPAPAPTGRGRYKLRGENKNF